MRSVTAWIGGMRATLIAAGAMVASTAAVAGLSGRLSPRLDALAHFAPIYALASLAALAATWVPAFPRPTFTRLICAIGLCASLPMMAPEATRATGPRAAADAQGQIKVIQINARWRNADIRRVADWLIAQDPDIVTISEARHDLRDLLIRRTRWRVAGGQGDLMIFTRSHYADMDRPFRRGGWDTTFVNATYASDSGPIEVVTTHMTWPTDPIVVQQIRDIEAVAGHRPRRRMILTGDMNATPWSAELQRLDRSLGLTRRDRAMPTYPAQVFGRPWPWPVLPIDHVYAGPGWATVRVERGPWVGSDHYPVIVTLAPTSTPR